MPLVSFVTDGGKERRRDGGTEERRDGRTEGRRDGGTDGRTDGRTDEHSGLYFKELSSYLVDNLLDFVDFGSDLDDRDSQNYLH